MLGSEVSWQVKACHAGSDDMLVSPGVAFFFFFFLYFVFILDSVVVSAVK